MSQKVWKNHDILPFGTKLGPEVFGPLVNAYELLLKRNNIKACCIFSKTIKKTSHKHNEGFDIMSSRTGNLLMWISTTTNGFLIVPITL